MGILDLRTRRDLDLLDLHSSCEDVVDGRVKPGFAQFIALCKESGGLSRGVGFEHEFFEAGLDIIWVLLDWSVLMRGILSFRLKFE